MPSSVFMEKFFLHSHSLRPSGGEQPRAQSRTELPPPGKCCPVQRTRGAQQRKRRFLTAQTQRFETGTARDAQPGPPPAYQEQSELSRVLRSRRADGAGGVESAPISDPGSAWEKEEQGHIWALPCGCVNISCSVVPDSR